MTYILNTGLQNGDESNRMKRKCEIFKFRAVHISDLILIRFTNDQISGHNELLVIVYLKDMQFISQGAREHTNNK